MEETQLNLFVRETSSLEHLFVSFLLNLELSLFRLSSKISFYNENNAHIISTVRRKNIHVPDVPSSNIQIILKFSASMIAN